jgi:Rrf2 family transcriptional regulator, iron-sulfur cluster assembly transcription factor
MPFPPPFPAEDLVPEVPAMLNQSADYALRAVLYIARQEDGGAPRSADAVASALGVPRNYLGKVLNTLAHAAVLESVRGPRGGFRLARSARQITLESVIEPFQRLSDRRVCLLGDRPCDATDPCDVHQRWRQIADPVNAFFRNTTIAALLAPLAEPRNGDPRERGADVIVDRRDTHPALEART